MRPRYYLDTSVFGGVFDCEFENESRAVFEKINSGQIICIYSGLTESELKRAPEEVRTFFQSLEEENLERVEINDAVLQLARKYIERKVVGETSFDDCVHIALATINKVDILVSWNFKHIVNETRISGYNSVNLLLGYNSVTIRSPRAIVQL